MGTRGALAVAVAVASLSVGACGEAGRPGQAIPAPPVATPSSLEDLPLGTPSGFPWLADGVLHAGGVSVSTDVDRLVHRGGTTLVGRVDASRSRWWLLEGGRLVPLVDDSTAFLVPVLSADGGTAAWRVDISAAGADEATSRRAWQVVVFDVPTRSVLGTTRLQGEVSCCDQGGMLTVAGVTNDGRVSLTGGPAGNLAIYRAGDPLLRLRVRGAAHPGADSWPLGVSYVRAGDSSGNVRFGRVDADGVVTEVGTTSDTAIWAPDGRRVADLDPSTGLEVTVPVTGQTVSLALPPAGDWQVLGWEGDQHVVAARVRTPGSGPASYVAVVRCDAVSGACERVAR